MGTYGPEKAPMRLYKGDLKSALYEEALDPPLREAKVVVRLSMESSHLGNGKEKPTGRLHDTENLLHRSPGIGKMFQDLVAEDKVHLLIAYR